MLDREVRVPPHHRLRLPAAKFLQDMQGRPILDMPRGPGATRRLRALARLDAVRVISDMDLPGFRLHPLHGDLMGFWAVTVRANWRIIFKFADGDASDVDYVDYH